MADTSSDDDTEVGDLGADEPLIRSTVIHDPDIDGATLRRRRLSNVLLTVGVLALVPGLGAAVIASLSGAAAAGAVGATATIGGVSAVLGGLLRRGTTRPRYDWWDVRIQRDVEDYPEADRDRAAWHMELVEELLLLVGEVRHRARATGLPDVAKSAERVAFRAAAKLSGAATELDALGGGYAADVRQSRSMVDEAHELTDQAVQALLDMEDALAQGTGATPAHGDARDRAALAEIESLTAWVQHRREALASLEGHAAEPADEVSQPGQI